MASIIVIIVFMEGSLFALLAVGPQVTQAAAAVQSVEELLGDLGSDVALPPALPAPAGAPILELAQVRFTYPEGQDGFDVGPIDLAVRPGEIVFLTGGNGSGKTTLAKVLVGLYPASEGRILLGGKEITTEGDRDAYRDHFAVVFSDGFVFPELWGVPPETVDEKANEFLRDLRIADKVQVRDGQFSSTHLSSGQKKRLALVVAYLEDRPFFVFDEWAAEQDPEFKRLFYTKYLPEIRKSGKSAIVISHDDRYFDLADRVVHLERGRVIDTETPTLAKVAG